MSESTEPKMNRRDVFLSWHRDPAFWRDVWVRTLSALITAAVVYVVALAAGLVPRPRPTSWLALVVTGGGLVESILALPWAWQVTPPGRERKRRMVLHSTLGVLFLVMFVGAVFGKVEL